MESVQIKADDMNYLEMVNSMYERLDNLDGREILKKGDRISSHEGIEHIILGQAKTGKKVLASFDNRSRNFRKFIFLDDKAWESVNSGSYTYLGPAGNFYDYALSKLSLNISNMQ